MFKLTVCNRSKFGLERSAASVFSLNSWYSFCFSLLQTIIKALVKGMTASVQVFHWRDPKRAERSIHSTNWSMDYI